MLQYHVISPSRFITPNVTQLADGCMCLVVYNKILHDNSSDLSHPNVTQLSGGYRLGRIVFYRSVGVCYNTT